MSENMKQLINDVKQIHTFLQTMENVQGVDSNVMEENQFQSFATRLNTVQSCTHEDGQELINVISQGPWTDPHKRHFYTCIGLVVTNNPTSSTRRNCQDITSFSKYLSAKDIQTLGSDATLITKLEALAHRCARVGISNPSEISVRQIMASGLVFGIQAATDKDKFAVVQEIKRLIKIQVKRRPKAAMYLVKYPTDPRNLPEVLFAAGYDAEDPPNTTAPDDTEIANAARTISLRRSSRSIRGSGLFGDAGNTLATAAAPAGNMNPWGNMMSGQCGPMQLMGSMLQMMQNMTAKNNPELDITYFNPAARAGNRLGSSAAAVQPNPAQAALPPPGGKEAATQPNANELAITPNIVEDPMPDAEEVANQVKDNKRQRGAPTTKYNGGKIHRSDTFSLWRVFIHEQDRVDKKIKFGTDMKASWKRALDMIDSGK
ncbi:unnamed protein product [Symbiodinium sp. CCMP2592]|nr:unnamed protein product [Symbiodinium sp. CCMP2592]